MTRLDVDRFADRGGGGFHDGFAQGRVGMDGLVNLIDRRFQFHGQAILGDQLRGFGADDVSTVDFACLGVGDNLDEALR